jgi:2-oxo-4-hydroxy-4-carboxy-5-ureidoimidazoline decarboxylase
LEAFSAHPKIGDINSLRAKYSATRDWSKGEQSGVDSAQEAVLEGLARGNADYEKRFGHIFIVCATGKTAAEMLDILQGRIGNDSAEELKIAAHEQSKITKIRLEKLCQEVPSQPTC